MLADQHRPQTHLWWIADRLLNRPLDQGLNLDGAAGRRSILPSFTNRDGFLAVLSSDVRRN